MGLVSKPVFPRIAKRFQVRQESSEQLETGKVLVPVTNADDLIKTPKVQEASDTATGVTHTFSIPEGKIWTIKGISGQRQQQGSIQIAIVDSDGYQIVLNYGTATDTFVAFPYLNFRMGTAWSIQIVYGTGTSGAMNSGILYEEEDLF